MSPMNGWTRTNATSAFRHVAGAMLLVLPWQATPPAVTDDSDPPARAARISYLSGDVSFQASGASDWSAATLNYSVTSGDRLVAGAAGRVELEVGSLSARLGEGADVTVATLDDHFTQFALSQGALRVSVYQMLPQDSVEIDTPNGALTILAAGKYRVDILPNERGTVVRVDEGLVELSGPGIARQLRAGSVARLTGTDPISLAPVAISPPDGFDQFSAERDRRATASPSVQYVGRDMPGAADLDEHGRWQQDAVYGPVWYPVRVPMGWVPYRYGHWAWIEPWGWVWVDDEAWGFAPFHYGRWVYVRSVWGWVPGPIVPRPWYAPALVVFVDGSHFSVGIGFQAWFPLGPREPYFPWYHHGERYLRSVNATNMRGVTDIEVILRERNLDHRTYVHRGAGITAVPGAVFRGGEPVGRQAVHVRPEEVGRAGIAAHPSVRPDERAAAGGRAAARPPAMPRRPIISAPPTRPEAPAREPKRVVPQSAVPGATRPLIVRHLPPAENPPIATRRDAMQADPGRPLEPQQMKNLRAGQPAGPPRDRENPAHPPKAEPKDTRKAEPKDAAKPPPKKP
ncbi:MAG: DUF6600 domain-containing protein [Gemmatimonadales bacterium]